MIVFYPKKYTLKCTFPSSYILAKKLSIKALNEFSCMYEKCKDIYGYYLYQLNFIWFYVFDN